MILVPLGCGDGDGGLSGGCNVETPGAGVGFKVGAGVTLPPVT